MRKKAVAAFIVIMGICATIFTPINYVSRADSTGKCRTFDKKTLYVHGYIVYRYNRNVSSDVEVSIPLWANNFWSEISLSKTEPDSAGDYVKYNVATEKYDLADKNDQDSIYSATFLFTDVQPYQEVKAEVWIELSISKVDMSLILSEHVGNVSTAKSAVETKYTEEEYYWDYTNSTVQKVIEEINQTTSGSQNVYDIVYAAVNWFSTHMVYREHEDYPAQRLRASQILNETTEVAGVEKRYGVCRHFTDAFVAIMRGFGVPTNLFNGLVFYDMGGDVGVIFSGGHAWCEVYMPNIGWVPVEVTISDRYLRDIIRVGLISEYYYLPTYKEFAHPAPKPGEPGEPKESYEYLVGSYWGWGVSEVPPTEEPPAGTLETIIRAIKSTPVMVWILLAVIVVLIVDSILIRKKIKALTSKVTPPPPPPPPSPNP